MQEFLSQWMWGVSPTKNVAMFTNSEALCGGEYFTFGMFIGASSHRPGQS